MKSKTQGKLWAILGTLVMLLPFFVGLGSVTASAEETDTDAGETVNVTLHKYRYDTKPETTPNTGEVMDFEGDPLNGIVFDVYDVTDKYWADFNPTNGDTAAAAAATAVTDYVEEFGVSEFVNLNTEGKPTENGQVTFELDAKSGNKDAVYIFVEKSEPGVEGASNMVLALPVYKVNSQTEINTDIHLYPKNVIKKSSITIKKVGNFEGADGLIASFKIKKDDQFVTGNNGNTGVATYGSEKDAKTFTTDKNGELTVSGLLDGDYTLIETEAPKGYQLSASQKETAFTVKDGKLATAEGLYNDTDEADLGNPKNVNNRENTLVANTITVENIQNYGDYHFVKQDLNTAKGLTGAEFNIAKESGSKDYLYEKKATTGDEYKYAWKSELTDTDGWDIVTLTSGSTGEFDITGLKYGTYYLHETVAPTGYVLPDSDFEFTVTDKSAAAEKDDVIENQPKGILPSTGGAGIVAFVAVGAALIVGGAFYFMKRRQETEA